MSSPWDAEEGKKRGLDGEREREREKERASRPAKPAAADPPFKGRRGTMSARAHIWQETELPKIVTFKTFMVLFSAW